MKIATILHVHRNTNLVLDTIDSLKTWVGSDILAVVDGKNWKRWGMRAPLGCHKMEGFPHAFPVASYRNHILGLMQGVKLWPDADWYLHTEYDTLFTSSGFKEDLQAASDRGAWCVGFDYREGDDRYYLLEAMLKMEMIGSKYLIGCCHFYKAEFIQRLLEIDFFTRFLNLTNGFSVGEFPGFKHYCFMEHLLPTLASHFGGGVEGLSYWKNEAGFGQYKKYPVRFRPAITWLENYPEASIMHPLKELDDPLRDYHKKKRRTYGRTSNFSQSTTFNSTTK